MPVYDMDKLMSRIKSLQEYTIERELPEDFTFGGHVPYDMKISNGTAFIKVYAADLEEANDKVDEFLIK
jgi:hypothetical protein